MVETKTSGKYESLREIRDRFRNLPEAKGLDPELKRVAETVSSTLARGLEGRSGEEREKLVKLLTDEKFLHWFGENPEQLLLRYLVGENYMKLSHPMRAMLAGIRGNISQIQRLSNPGDGDGDRYIRSMSLDKRLEHINDITTNAVEIINDGFRMHGSLNITLAAGKTTQTEEVDVNSLLKGPFESSIPSAMVPEDLLESKWNLDKKLPRVRTDPMLLQAVLINVYMNSMHALEDSKVKVLHTTTAREGDNIIINIKDTGYGFNPDELVNENGEPNPKGKVTKKEWIMGLFNTTKGERGTGLGLYLSANVMKTLGGSFDINSEGKGKGATVTIKLPTEQLTKEQTKSGGP